MTDFLRAEWTDLIMANYAVDTATLTPYLPAGVELDLYNGEAYVSLVGFMFRNTRIFGVPIPVLGTFEEINLRFYVKRREGDTWKRGVVFINETIPYKVVAWVANKLYKEHYTAIATRHRVLHTETVKHIKYLWRLNKQWHHISVAAETRYAPMLADSMEAFIFEHYYGYTKVSASATEEYQVAHPSWNTHKVTGYYIQCDFSQMYGSAFGCLNTAKPRSVFLAEGSGVSVKWKRNRLAL
jgi:hypothetical protein